MKIAYISSPAYSDVDISFVSVAQKVMDIDYYLDIGPCNRRSNAIDLSNEHLKDGVTCASEIPFFTKFNSLIDLSKVYVIYNSVAKGYAITSIVNNYKVYRYLKKKRYDVIHITTEPSYGNLFLYLFGKKLVMTVHDPIRHSSSNRWIEEVNRKMAFRRIQTLILLNKSQRDEFVEKYKVPQKTRILFSSLSSYDYLNIYDKVVDVDVAEEKYILFFGNILSYKGLDYLFPAMDKLHDTHPDVKLIVAGRGEYYFDISNYRDKPFFRIINDFIPDSFLAELIKNCLFVVIPYVDATQSGVTMSAYAYCKPCVATRVGGLPEMVIDGEYGIIVPPKDVNALETAMSDLLQKPDLLRSYSDNIRRDYKEGNKSWKYIAKELLSIYKTVDSL